jgi:hypothetical protein
MSEELLRSELYGSFRNRALLYHLIFEELQKEVGGDRAEAILSQAIYRRGEQIGREKFAQFAPCDIHGLKNAFLNGIPDNGNTFKPEVRHSDSEGFDIQFHGCPLRDAWQAAGLPPEKVALLCRIAARVDNGTFEGAGFDFWADTWKPGSGDCCFLHVRKKGSPRESQ